VKNLIKHNDTYYIVKRSIKISTFTNKDGTIDENLLHSWRDTMINIDHILKDDNQYLFVETVTDAVIE